MIESGLPLTAGTGALTMEDLTDRSNRSICFASKVLRNQNSCYRLRTSNRLAIGSTWGDPMHIPDNYLSPGTCALMGAAMLPVWSVSVRKARSELEAKRVPMLGISAAFSFLIMLFNIPAPGGTTAHAVGGTLIAVLVGPWAACIAVSVALLIQALLFGDGGILAYGANCFNMAFVIPFVGYFVYGFLKDRFKSERAALISLGLGAYFAINLAAFCAAIEFGLQPVIAKDLAGLPLYCPYPLALAIPGMMLPHLLVAGFVEGFFTVSAFAFIKRVSPGSVYQGGKTRIPALYGLLAALVCLCPLGLLADSTAWGEWGVAEIRTALGAGQGLAFVPSGMAHGALLKAFWPDYAVSGLPGWAGYVWSAFVGAASLLIIFKLFGLLKRAGTRA
jgi:cobalt/nickel transport system permease protein